MKWAKIIKNLNDTYMAKVTMCANITCSRNAACHRFNAEPNLFGQVYADLRPKIDNGQKFDCEYFMENRPESGTNSEKKGS